MKKRNCALVERRPGLGRRLGTRGIEHDGPCGTGTGMGGLAHGMQTSEQVAYIS